jgi:uncharacterized protein
MAHRSWAITLLGLAGAALLAKDGHAASFNCDAAATATDKAICGNDQLSTLDVQTAGMYYSIVGASPPAATLSAVKTAQRQFLKKRDGCGADLTCLIDAYTSQAAYLRQTRDQLFPSPDDWVSFASPAFGFSIRYLRDYTVDPAYRYEGLGPGKEISGVSFTIPEAMTKGTNLSDDSYISVETLPDAASCTAGLFSDAEEVRDEKEGKTEYSVAELGEGAAGNVYEEHVYALVGSSPCLAVRYLIHSGNMAMYDPGAVRAFDEPALLRQFDKIRKSLVIGR